MADRRETRVQGTPPRGATGAPCAAPSGGPREPDTVVVFSGGGTGGHLYPALALANGLQVVRPGIRPFFVGAQVGLEARILPERGLDHLLLPVRGFRRGAVRENLGVLFSLLRSLFPVGEVFGRLRPALVVVTGGFAGGPAGIVAGLMGIPLALQEQNALPGFTSRVLSRWSRQIHLAFPEARDRLPRRARPRATISGNPIRTPSRTDRPQARAELGLDLEARVVLVVGGSQGSAALNRAVTEMVRGIASGALSRPPDVQFLWGTGPSHLEGVRRELGSLGDPAWVRAHGYFHQMPLALDAADVVVSRSGAMTTSEILAWGLPSILVPLPTSAEGHQALNAESLEKAGAAVHLPESEISGTRLWDVLGGLLGDPSRLAAMGEAARKRARPEATEEIARALTGLLPGKRGGAA